MKYIDLTLTNHNKEDPTEYTIKDIIENNKVIIILGPPGSGKTSSLRKYNLEHEDSQFINIKKFINSDVKFPSEIETILLDGLDEYRSLPNKDKSYVVTELGLKINNIDLDKSKIVISCREMDWYGEEDITALKEEITYYPAIFNICPLDIIKQREFAEMLGVKEIDSFIEQFSDSGFLNNPQLFKMIADIYIKKPNYKARSKKDIFMDFIINSREVNPSYRRNEINSIEPEEFLRHLGYIAFFYMFSDVESLNEKFIDEVSSVKHELLNKNLKITLNTALFSDERFIHRTIAEYACAFYINQYKLLKHIDISYQRVKSLFVYDNKIPTELRGAFAWLCAFSKNDELIKIDPYYQAVHGDNSAFSLEDKKRIIIAVKEYSKSNPYFIRLYYREKADGFYDKNLDDFLINEYKEAIKMNNHYIYFISSVLTSSYNLSNNIKEFVKEIFKKPEINNYYKVKLVEVLFDDVKFLINFLNDILDSKIPDEDDSLKDVILYKLYPEEISSSKISEYILSYNHNKIGGHCYYLYKTDYSEKYKLVDELLKRYRKNSKDDPLAIPSNIESFIEHYLMETILLYDEKYNSYDIFKILKHFSNYYGPYHGPNFSTYKKDIQNKIKEKEKKINKLVNDLFSVYIDDIPNDKDFFSKYYEFEYVFNFKIPDKKYEILLNKLNPENSKEKNINILVCMAQENKSSTNIADDILKLAKKYGVENDLRKWLFPQPSIYEIERNKKNQERENKIQKEIEKNEKYFKSKNDEVIISDFNILFNVASYLFINDSTRYKTQITDKTFSRLKNILKKIILKPQFDKKCLTINSLAESSPDARRNIDRVYYVACQLNNKEQYIELEDKSFKKYLYICSLARRYAANVIQGNFTSWLEKADQKLAIETLKEFIKLLINKHFTYCKKIFEEHINEETDIDKLKDIAILSILENKNEINCILENLLKTYNFNYSELDLINILKNDDIDESNRNILNSLIIFKRKEKEKLTIEVAINLYTLLKVDMSNGVINSISSEDRVSIFDFLISIFNTEESIKHKNGIQSDKDMCANFLSGNVFFQLSTIELKELLAMHSDDNDIWKKRILNTISEKEQSDVDIKIERYTIQKAKEFILSDAILNEKDFFQDIVLKIKDLKNIIESNRNNEKMSFRDSNKDPRSEELCRDRIVHEFNARYGYDLDISREKLEASNRVDINIKYKVAHNYEVQVECKKDKSQEIYSGLKAQLVNKYLSNKVAYGIYLIFYFGEREKDRMIKTIKKNIPENYKENIEVIIIDLTLE